MSYGMNEPISFATTTSLELAPYIGSKMSKILTLQQGVQGNANTVWGTVCPYQSARDPLSNGEVSSFKDNMVLHLRQIDLKLRRQEI